MYFVIYSNFNYAVCILNLFFLNIVNFFNVKFLLSIFCIIFYFTVSMTSLSSSSSSIHIKSDPIDEDVLWMQGKHVSEHVWNGEPDRKLHTSDELSSSIKDKKKYQRKLFLYFGNLVFIGY